MALINCVECSREVSDQAALCPNCGCPVANSITTLPPAPDPSGKTNYFFKYIQLIIPLAVFALIVLFNVLISGDDRVSKASEGDVLYACDIATQRQNKNPTSYSLAGSWDTRTSGEGMVIRRNFTAMNGFGANIDHYFKCTYNLAAREIVSLEVKEGNWE